ncbi:MAG TPA: hypothetical protein VGO11_10000 [Chthoniobacteraceae bacterium]|jgi:hypothetical protein|nr:hypothetical protein [Chthoniobacteraceae bacterium]
MTASFHGSISIGDLVRAAAEMRATEPDSIVAIARALGLGVTFGLRDTAPGERPLVAPPSTLPSLPGAELPLPEPSPLPTPTPASPGDPPSPAPAGPAASASWKPVEFDLEVSAQPALLPSVDTTTEDEVVEEFPTNDRPLPMPPLFHPGWQASLLAELVATSFPGHRLDVGRLIHLLARGRWPTRLPFLETRLVSFGCQFLIDTATGMEPFAWDRQALWQAARDLVGDDRLVVRFFRDCPSFGVEDPKTFEFAEWKPPLRRCPVVVMTEFGLSVPFDPFSNGTLEDWISFADRVLHYRLPLIFLVPRPRHRIPKSLRRRATVITWDRPTTPGEVRRLRASGVPGMYG